MSAQKDSRERDVMTYVAVICWVIYLYPRGICAGNSLLDEAIKGSEVIESVGYDRSWINHI